MNETKQLSIELLRRIFGNLGAIPGKNFGKFGISSKEYIIDRFISAKSENNEVENLSVWGGKITVGLNSANTLLTNFGDTLEPDFIMVISLNKSVFGLRLDWFGDNYFCASLTEQGWISLNIQQQLNLALLIEAVTQNGILWEILDSVPTIFETLISLIEGTEIAT